ncbi:hypothetical protein Misp06_03893 [Microbulbifer sp. NBRC 101763]|uniref:hypothetical protein n=1 Tax=Microbulbifer TaxID=48073 RepID=UPI000380EF4C|nr:MULTISPECIES: hypothetical protein [Microbulbifer]WHI50615.1 hypothetical protein P3339_19615 [Microbulbifer sp. MLAF003]
MKLRCVLPLLSLCILPASAETLILSDKQLLNTGLKEARLISELHGYAIVAGRYCVDCDENLAIYIHQIPRQEEGGGELLGSIGSDRYTYPGRYIDYMTKKLVEKTRMFYGYCYEGQASLLWLTEYFTGDKWVKAEYLIVLGDNGLEHRYNENQQPGIFNLENEDCRELKGIFAEMEP